MKVLHISEDDPCFFEKKSIFRGSDGHDGESWKIDRVGGGREIPVSKNHRINEFTNLH